MSLPAPVLSPINSDYDRGLWRVPLNTKVVVGRPAPACIPSFAAVCGRKYLPGPQRTMCLWRSGCISPACMEQQLKCMLKAPPSGDWRPCVAATPCGQIQTPQPGYFWNPNPAVMW